MIIIEKQSSVRKRAKFSPRILSSRRTILLAPMPNELTPCLNQLFCLAGTKSYIWTAEWSRKATSVCFPTLFHIKAMNWSGVLLRIGVTENSKHVLVAVTPFLAETYWQRPCKKTFQQALHRVTLKVETGSGTLKLVSKCCFRRPLCFGRRRLQWVKAELLFHFLIGLRSVA